LKTLVDINHDILGKVKDFATVRDLPLNLTVESLLIRALDKFAYSLRKEEERTMTRHEVCNEIKASLEGKHHVSFAKRGRNDSCDDNIVQIRYSCGFCEEKEISIE
jgi:hypothetical protein